MTDRTPLQEALDPRTSTQRLDEIYRAAYAVRRVSDIAEAVAAHPNTRPYLLEVLAQTYPKAVLSNPVLPRIFQKDPKWPQGYQTQAALSLLRFENVPLPLLRAFAEKPDMVGDAARRHIGLAGEAGPEWETDAREALWELSALEEEFSASLLTFDLVPDWLLEPLAGHKDSHVRRAAARHPRTPPGVLTSLRRAGSTSDLGGLAPPDSSLPAPVLSRLARGGSWARRLAARHPSTPPESLEWLADNRLGRTKWNKDKTLSRYLLCNPSMPAARLAALAVENDTEFRRASARDPKSPPLALAALSADEVRDVRWMAARNPNTPREALEVLAADPDARVRQGVGRNTAALSALLARLAADPVRWVRLAAARHPQTPPRVLEWLAEDDDAEVREAVARRTRSAPPVPRPPKLPRPALEAVPKHALPPHALPPLIDPDERLKTLDFAVQSGGLRGGLLTHLVALACPDTPLPVLLRGAADPRWPCRLAVARNPVAFLLSLEQPGTDADLHALALDGNRLVRAAARVALASTRSVE